MKTIPVVAICAKVDIAKLASDGKTGVMLPKGFVYTGVFVRELVKADASGTVTVKAGTTGIAAGVNIGGDAAADDFKTATTVAKLASTVDLVATISSGVTTGVLDVSVIGYYVKGGCYGFDADVSNDINGDGSSTDDNVAPVDPYIPPEKA